MSSKQTHVGFLLALAEPLPCLPLGIYLLLLTHFLSHVRHVLVGRQQRFTTMVIESSTIVLHYASVLA